MYSNLESYDGNTLPFENCTIRRDVGKKCDIRVGVRKPKSSSFWLCPRLNCLCKEEGLCLPPSDLSLTQRSMRPINYI